MSRVTEAHKNSALAAHGFTEHDGVWRRGELEFASEAGWSLLAAPARGREVSGRGLWRTAPDPIRHVFEIPERLAAGDPGQTFAQMLAFGVAGYETELSSTFELEDLPPPRTVRKGPGTSQGCWQVDHRLALRYPLAAWPASASRERILWLERTLDEARRWRFVRIHRDDQRVHAEVELTGAPQSLIGPLARLAQDALMAAVAWLLPSLSVLTEHEVRAIARLRRKQARGRVRPETSKQQEIHT